MWGRRTFLPSSSIPPHLRIGDHFRTAYAPQMLPSFLEMPNFDEGQIVRMVAPASETDDAIYLAKVLPGRTRGVSFVLRSCLRLLPSFLRVSVRKYGMAGNTYMRSGYVLSRLFLAIRQPGAMSTCVGMTIYLLHFVVNLASSERHCLQRSSPFSRHYSA